MSKGFTLIELLIVIGILAILATATVLVLNPAQLFAQARDAQRLADLDALRSAITLYLSSVTSPTLQAAADFRCSDDLTAANRRYGASFAGATKYLTSAGTEGHGGVRTTAGAGWVAVDFTGIPGGSPFSILPADPTNNATYNYQYACNEGAKTFELDALLESTKYRTTDDLDGKDGGNSAVDGVYEVGSNLAL